MPAATESPRGTGIWRRYKLGQAQFTHWLKETASKYTRGKEADDDAEPGTSGLPGKAKKKKNTTKTTVQSEDDASAAPPVMRLKELESLALAVVNSADPDDISEEPIRILRDVVDLRKRSATFYRAAAEKSRDMRLKRSIVTHDHMIVVLDRILDNFDRLLRRAKSAGAPAAERDGAKEKGDVSAKALDTMFKYLKLYPTLGDADEEEEEDDDAETQSVRSQQSKRSQKSKGGRKPKKPKNKNVKASKLARSRQSASDPGRERVDDWVSAFSFEAPSGSLDADDPFDVYLLVYCFFEDFNLIRDYVLERWCDYYYDESNCVSPDAIAVVTNAAFEMFHQLEDDLEKISADSFPNITKYMVLLVEVLRFEERTEFNIDAERGRDGKAFLHYADEHGQYDFSFDNPLTEWLATPAFGHLMGALSEIKPGKDILRLPEDPTRPKLDYQATKSDERYAVVGHVMKELLQSVHHITAMKTTNGEDFVMPAEPELLLDISDAFRFRAKPSAALVFSLQLWVDIRMVLEDRTHDIFDLMQRAGWRSRRLLERNKAVAETGPRKATCVRNFTRRAHDLKRHLLQDFTYEDQRNRFRHYGFPEKVGTVQPFFLYRREPVWAGLLMMRARLIESHFGHLMSHTSFIIEAACYIHAAARAVDPAKVPAWPAMSAWLRVTYSDASTMKAGLDGSYAQVLSHYVKAVAPWSLNKYDHRSVREACNRKDLSGAIGIRETLFNRYADNRRDCYYFMQYLENVAVYRLRLDYHDDKAFVPERLRDNLQVRRAPAAAAAANDDALGGGLKRPTPRVQGGKIPDNWSREGDEDMDPFARGDGRGGGPLLDAAAEDVLRRRAALARLSPIEMLKLLDEAVTGQLEDVLAVDYFGLFSASVAYLRCVLKAMLLVEDGQGGDRRRWCELMGFAPSELDGDGLPHAQGVAPDRLAGLPALLGEAGETAGPLLAACTTTWLAAQDRIIPEDLGEPGEESPTVERPLVDIKLQKKGLWGRGWQEGFEVFAVGNDSRSEALMRDPDYMANLLWSL